MGLAFISNTLPHRAARSGLCVTMTDVSPRFAWHSRIRSNTRSLQRHFSGISGSEGEKIEVSDTSHEAIATLAAEILAMTETRAVAIESLP